MLCPIIYGSMSRFEVEKNVDFQDYLDEVTENEIMRHTDIETDGDKISNIWGILGLTNEADLARILGIDQRQIPKIFKSGVNDQSIKRRLNRAFAYASILERNLPDLLQRKIELERPHPFLRYKSPIESLKQGHIDQVLYFAAQTPSI